MTLSSRLTRSPGLRRPVFAFLALLHLVAAVAVPAADALEEASAWDATAHVESGSDPGCDVHHDDLFCQLCRSLGHLAGVPPGRALHAIACTEHDLPGRFHRSIPSGTLRTAPLGARAPPLS